MMRMILKEGLWKDMLNMETNNRWIELGLGKLYAIWLREFKVFLREKSRLIASTFTPLLWLFVIGEGFGSTTDIFGTARFAADTYIGYQQFIFPGIICMSVIFTSVFFGSYIIWDRKFDFLKSVMVAPVSRTTIFLGKAFGGMTTSLIQAGYIASSWICDWNSLYSIVHGFYYYHSPTSFLHPHIAWSYSWESYGKFRRFSANRKLCCISPLLPKWGSFSTR